jgi:CheY-like chemotaxis protein
MVTDYNMPGMNGAELTQKVKSRPKYSNMPVLILSSEKAEEMKRAARDAGAYGWLSKPFNMDRFLKIVNTPGNHTKKPLFPKNIHIAIHGSDNDFVLYHGR